MALVVTSRPNRLGAVAAVLVYVGTFQALRVVTMRGTVEEPGWAPWRRWAFRGTLGYAALMSGYLLYGLGWPPADPKARGSMIALVTLLLAACCASVFATHRPRVSAALAALMAGYACFVFGRVLATSGRWWEGQTVEPATTVAFALAVSTMCACFSAFIYTRPLWPWALGGDHGVG